MPDPIITQAPQVIVNKMTQAQYDQITPSDTEFYLITDSTSQFSNFRGTFSNSSAIPSDTSLYLEDASGNKVPNDTDYIIISDASDYSGAIVGEIVIFETTDTSGGATLGFNINGVTRSVVYNECMNNDLTIGPNNEIIVNYTPPNWIIKSNLRAIYNGVTYNAGNTIASFVYDVYKSGTIQLIESSSMSGRWYFNYRGTWGNDGVSGWVPCFEVTGRVAPEVKNQNTSGNSIKFWTGTQAAYDTLVSNSSTDPNTIYFT